MQPDFNEYKRPFDGGGFRRLKIAGDWDSPQFRDCLFGFEKHFQRRPAFHDYRNVLVRIGPDDALGVKKEIVAKKFRLFRKYDHLRFYFIPSKAIRSLKTALTLLGNGLKTPRPVAIIEDYGPFNKPNCCYYLSEFLEYDCSMAEAVRQVEDDRQRRLIAAAAREIGRMHRIGLVHNDLHLSNILIKNLEGEPELYFIDLNRARQKPALSIKARAKDLIRLALKPEELSDFLTNYDYDHYRQMMVLVRKFKARRERWLNFKAKIRRLKSGVKLS